MAADRPATTDRYDPVCRDSLAYQNYLSGDATMLAKVNGLSNRNATR